MQQVTVDNDFARFGVKSYAINKITSIEDEVEATRDVNLIGRIVFIGRRM